VSGYQSVVLVIQVAPDHEIDQKFLNNGHAWCLGGCDTTVEFHDKGLTSRGAFVLYQSASLSSLEFKLGASAYIGFFRLNARFSIATKKIVGRSVWLYV